MNQSLNEVLSSPFFGMVFGQTAPAAPQQAPAGGGMIMLGYILFMFAIMYFIIFRPQAKARKEQEKLIASVKTGDEIVTNGGIMGTVSNVKDKSVMVKVADNVKIEILKSHILSVTKPDKEEKK